MIDMKRLFALDYIRVIAITLVVLLHSSTLYYINPKGGILINEHTSAIAFVVSLCRAGVPLFVIISGYLLLPMQVSIKQFFSRRFSRVLIPFVFWSIVYALFQGGLFSDGHLMNSVKLLLYIPINFVTTHMWYVYMLLGLYLLVPILSPWIKQAGKKEMSFFLMIWLLASFISYIHLRFQNILGECEWNSTSTFYYFQGFLGYFLMGAYFKKYGVLSLTTSLCVTLIGYLLTVLLFSYGLHVSASDRVLNTIWNYCSFNIVLLSVGLFCLFYNLFNNKKLDNGSLLLDVSKRSYVIYLAHILVLRFVSKYVMSVLDSSLIAIPCIAIVVFLITYIVCRVMSKLPLSEKWLG